MSAIVDGELIRQLRERRGWSQRELALAAQVDPSVVSRLERGLQDDVKLSVVVALARVLDVSIDHLVRIYRQKPGTLIAEMSFVIEQLAQQPIQVQRYAFGILRGLLSIAEDS